MNAAFQDEDKADGFQPWDTANDSAGSRCASGRRSASCRRLTRDAGEAIICGHALLHGSIVDLDKNFTVLNIENSDCVAVDLDGLPYL